MIKKSMKFKVSFVDYPLNNKAGWGNVTGSFVGEIQDYREDKKVGWFIN